MDPENVSADRMLGKLQANGVTIATECHLAPIALLFHEGGRLTGAVLYDPTTEPIDRAIRWLVDVRGAIEATDALGGEWATDRMRPVIAHTLMFDEQAGRWSEAA